MLTVDARCTDHRCNEPNIYRMVGHCTNCGTRDILILLTAGHQKPVYKSKCPVCGCSGYSAGVTADRLATEDEIPAAVEAS